MKFDHTIDESREKYPEITNELLENLQTWAEEKGLPRIPKEQLAIFAHSCYYDVETTKRCMNIYYRMRVATPEFFNNRDTNLDYLQHSLKVLELAVFPKPDQNGNWIIFQRLANTQPSQYMFNDAVKLLLMAVDANLYTNGCSSGYIFLFDMNGVQLGHLTRLSINSIRKFFEYIQEGMPVRLKGIHVLNAVWFVDKVIALIKPFMKQELYNMLYIHTGDVSNVYPYISPEYLPKDYGGELDSIENLHKAHSLKLNQLQNYFREEETLFRSYS